VKWSSKSPRQEAAISTIMNSFFPGSRRFSFIRVLLSIVAALAIVSCSTVAPPEPVTEGQVTSANPSVPSASSSDENQMRLSALWAKRTAADDSTLDYPIGPGDVIQVSVPGVDDLHEQTVRVGARGRIDLPLVGTVQAGGLTEGQLRDSIKQALTKYMYDPQVDVFVKEYHSRQVAVVGCVRQPGLITLTGTQQTILDVLTAAGGTTPEAADELVMLPGVPGTTQHMQQLADQLAQDSSPSKDQVNQPASANQPAKAPNAIDESEPAVGIVTVSALEHVASNGPAVIVPIRANAYTGSRHFINLPVAPGDVIVVPGGGNVMVTGWVYKPGFFQVGSGLTVLGAVGSAGGAMYAADPTRAVLIRSVGNGNKVSIPINLTRIAKGEDPDIPVHGNDVVDVPYSNARIGPYVVYNILSKLAVPLPVY
jgi:protein involved in polysaccharide export with SLBB domain